MGTQTASLKHHLLDQEKGEKKRSKQEMGAEDKGAEAKEEKMVTLTINRWRRTTNAESGDMRGGKARKVFGFRRN